MNVTLVYNEKAGGAGAEDEVLAGLADIGWKVSRRITTRELESSLGHGADLFVAAGGDGTIGKVAKRVARTEIPMAIVPMGTANNVARSLGLGIDPVAAIAGLRHAVERRIDLGVVGGTIDNALFIEGFGVGVFADIMAERASKKDKKLRKALRLIADELEAYEPRHLELEVEGRDMSGLYILAAVMNGRSLGPALCFAPDARPDDGELDVVLVSPEAKPVLVSHLRRALEDGDIALPAFETVRATRVRMRADDRWAHVDDEPRVLHGHVTIDISANAVKLLAPSPAPPGRDG